MSSATHYALLTKEDDVNLEPKEFLLLEPQIVEIDPMEVRPEGSDAA
jgi:hypothetical protein